MALPLRSESSAAARRPTGSTSAPKCKLPRGRLIVERLKWQHGDCGPPEDRLDLGRLRRECHIVGSGFGAVASLQGVQDGGDMGAHRRSRNRERDSNLLVGQPLGEQLQDTQLAGRQATHTGSFSVSMGRLQFSGRPPALPDDGAGASRHLPRVTRVLQVRQLSVARAMGLATVPIDAVLCTDLGNMLRVWVAVHVCNRDCTRRHGAAKVGVKGCVSLFLTAE